MSKKRSPKKKSKQQAQASPPGLPDDARLDRMVEPEYASVSGLAIFSLVLSAVGVIAFLPQPPGPPLPLTWFRLPILLLLPLAAMPFAMVAVRQIRRSAGTKTGLRLAHSALALSLIFALGAGAVHGFGQWERHSRQQALVAASEEMLQAMFKDQPDVVFAKLLDSEVAKPDHRDAFLRGWSQRQRLLHEDLGGYYGRHVAHIGARQQDAKDEAETQYDIGVVIHRLQFGDMAMFIVFEFRLIENQWKLIGLNDRQSMEYPPEDAKPKPRFEP